LIPLAALEVKLVEVVQLFGTIMSSEQVHVILNYSAASPIPWGWYAPSYLFDRRPLVSNEVEAMEIVLVVTIIASINVERIFINYCGVRVARSWGCFLLIAEHFLPRIVVDVVLIEIVHSVEPIIATEDKDRS
jgi:hypothetical protein